MTTRNKQLKIINIWICFFFKNCLINDIFIFLLDIQLKISIQIVININVGYFHFSKKRKY